MVASVRASLAEALGSDPDARDVLERWDRWGDELLDGLAEVYPDSELAQRLVTLMADAFRARSGRLRARDRERILRPDWIQSPSTIGYAAYADRFAGTLAGVRDAIPYLQDLGVSYLHLMPLLKPRPEPSDGGYAVADYRNVRADLGTMEDLAALAESLHDAGLSLTLDLVLNHVAREHAWAQAARSGDARYRDYFHVFNDRTLPDEYERSLPEVFPDFAPGNFTWDADLQAWVWTTFNSWQWDVNWSNPDVFCEFADIILFLANQGVDCLRLDAIAFVWKRMGTMCQNQPEVHAITQALRAVARIVAPALVFKAEAIVAPNDLVAYLGTGEHAGKVSDLAYQNSLMVQIWSALAAQDGRLMAVALDRFPAIPTTTAWATYLRCHDDIGWAIDDGDAAALGWSGHGHRAFLADFYTGAFEGSLARGVDFQANPLTGDRRTSGTATGLTGVEAALAAGDERELARAIDRMMCGYAMVMGYGGIPLIYMGDEIGLLTDHSYQNEPGLAEDNRWMHRPRMDWAIAAQRNDATSLAGRIWSRMRRLIAVRASLDSLHAATATHVDVPADWAVIRFARRHASGSIVQLYNVADGPRHVPASVAREFLEVPWDALSDSAPAYSGDDIVLPAYGVLWLVER